MRRKRAEKFEKFVFRAKLTTLTFAVLGAVLSLGSVAARMSPADDGGGIELPVLMYHAIMSDPGRSGEYVITPDEFRRDLEYIASQGYETVLLSDVVDYVESGAPLPDKPIMITLDDGYYNNYLYAYPALKESGMCAVISVIGVEADRYTDSPDLNEAYAHCSWDVLREMESSGVIELLSHSYDMHHLDGEVMGIARRSGEELAAYRSRLYADLERMQGRFRAELGHAPEGFAYPFGFSTADSRPVIERLGFLATLGVEGRTFVVTRDLSCLENIPRYNRPSGTSARSILETA